MGVFWGLFGAPSGPQKYIFAKINPTIVCSAKNYYTHLYWATIAHSEYLGTYFSQVWPQNSQFQGILGALYGPKKTFFGKMDPTIIFSAKNYYTEPLQHTLSIREHKFLNRSSKWPFRPIFTQRGHVKKNKGLKMA